MKQILLALTLIFLSIESYGSTKLQISPVWEKDSVQSIQMVLPVKSDFKSAIFSRNGYTYFIFKSNDGFKVNDSELKDLPIIQLPHPNALILRAVLLDNLTPQFFIQNHLLRLKMQTNKTNEKTLFETKYVPQGLLLETSNAEVIEFKDPNTLENLVAFLTPYSPIFVKEKYDTPEMTLLPTFHGIAIYPKTKTLHIQPDKDGFIILPQNSKTLSVFQNQIPTKQFKWNKYANLLPNEINTEEKNLKNFLPYVSAAGRKRLFQEIALIHLTQAHAAEAIEVASLLDESDTKYAINFIALVLQNKKEQALTQWHKIKDTSTFLQLWENSIDDAPLKELHLFEQILMPDKMAAVFWQNVALKADAQNSFLLLALAADNLEKLQLNTYQNQALVYFKARILERENAVHEAFVFYQKALTSPLSDISAKVILNKIKLAFSLGKIRTQEAIFELEKLRPLVTFSNDEAPVLQLLSMLYTDTNNLPQALRTDRRLLSITDDEVILKRMQRNFERFFLTHQNPQPLHHSALYYEFKELMPIGISAAQVKQHLIDDFIQMDLLQEAYDLSMELVWTNKGQIQKEAAAQAYLLAKILSDKTKIEQAKKYLNDDWKSKINPEKLKPILKWAFDND